MKCYFAVWEKKLNFDVLSFSITIYFSTSLHFRAAVSNSFKFIGPLGTEFDLRWVLPVKTLHSNHVIIADF